MDSLERHPHERWASSRATSRSDLYNIQQQLVQLQELTGQSQQRLSELRTQLEARERADRHGPTARRHRPRRRPRRRPPRPTRCTRRRWRSSAAAAPPPRARGLRELLRTYPTSERAGDALYFIGQSFAAENPDSAAAYYNQVVQKYPTLAARRVGAVQPRPAGRAAEGNREGARGLPAGGPAVPPLRRSGAGP